jgi:hypothetical protein
LYINLNSPLPLFKDHDNHPLTSDHLCQHLQGRYGMHNHSIEGIV